MTKIEIGGLGKVCGKFCIALFAMLTIPSLVSALEPVDNSSEVEVRFARGDAVYSGTLSKPAGAGKFPLVILVSGMGPQDRDWNFGKNYKLAKIIADHLVGNGIAVYRYDDRGVGKSTGVSETLTSFDDLAEDVYSALSELRKRSDIGKIGLMGHSLGGILSVMAASRHSDIDFIITLSGSYQNGGDIMMEQARTLKRWKTSADMTDDDVVANGERFVRSWISYSRGGEGLDVIQQTLSALIHYQISKLTPEKMAENLRTFKDEHDFFEKTYNDAVAYYISPHQKSFAVYDPTEDFKKIACPVLILFGEKDKHVTVESNMPKVAKALGGAKVADLAIRIVPEVDHGYSTPELYKQGAVGPGMLEYVTNWVLYRK